MKRTLVFVLTLCLAVFLIRCQNKKAGEQGHATVANSVKTHAAPFKFPEPEDTINAWLNNNDQASIAAHGWGLWQIVTAPATDNRPLYVYQTWPTPADIIRATRTGGETKSLLQGGKNVGAADFHIPQQFVIENEGSLKSVVNLFATDPSLRMVEDVRYSPQAAAFATEQKLFLKGTQQKLLEGGHTDVPAFPITAMTMKPMYKIITKKDQKDGQYYPLNVWPGPPADADSAFPEEDWGTSVYVDMKNQSHGKGGTSKKGGGRRVDNTYNLSDFIYYVLSEAEAESLNKTLRDKDTVYAGDIALLVGMHLTSRETTRWTWQSFWWTPDPTTVPAPSTDVVVANRPASLTGGQAHYGMCTGYSYIDPNQPLTGGNNKGNSIYAYNPYIEAGFKGGPHQALNIPAEVITNGQTVHNDVGVRSNCMSCHAYSTFDPNGSPQHFSGDTYTDTADPFYKSKLKLEFAYSLHYRSVNK